jgi:hypothetical protein
MRKLIAGAALALTAGTAIVGGASVAGAAPSKNVEVYICDGVETEIVVAGRSGWIDGVHYLAHNIVVEGTFTPAGGEPEPFTDTQWTSGRTGGLECTRTETFTDEEGTGTFTVALNAIPTGR